MNAHEPAGVRHSTSPGDDRTLASRAQVRTVACPSCGSLSGAVCIGARGKPRESNHRERVQLWYAVNRGIKGATFVALLVVLLPLIAPTGRPADRPMSLKGSRTTL